jgi:hypothetical protein
MTRTLVNSFAAASLIAVALVAGTGPRSVAPALAATTTTITFDDLAPGTSISNQYHGRGVDFETGIIGNNVYCYPVVKQVAAQDAASGDQVADTSCANGEFPDSSIVGVLSNSAQHLSVYAGFFPDWSNPPPTEQVTLTAYDIDGNVVTSDTESVPDGGTHTLLQVTSGSANIVQFDVTATDPTVAIDNLTFDNPAGVPPNFRIRPEHNPVGVLRGLSIDDVIDIHRLNGSSGGITFTAAGLPRHVHASFNPNPSTGDTTTMTISADRSAPLTGTTATVTGTPDSPSAGPKKKSAKLGVDVFAPFTISAPSTVQVSPCSQIQIPVNITWFSFSASDYTHPFTDPITLSISGLPPDDQASLSPVTVSPNSGTNLATSTLTLTSQSDFPGPATKVKITGTSGQLKASTPPISFSRVGPIITSVSPEAGQAPQGLQGGSEVFVNGQGLCPGTELAFGNQQALIVSPIPHGAGNTGLQAIVPRLATTGKVYAIPPSGNGNIHSAGASASPDTFTVDNYRDTNGFSFINSDAFQSRVGGYSFSDVSDVFGDAQTHLSANPCWPFGDCTIVTPVPDPFALLFWWAADSALQGGQCFGFGLASQRLLHGDKPYYDFPLQAGTNSYNAWNLQGPESSGGASDSLAHFIHLMHLEQFSGQALSWWLNSAINNGIFGGQSSIIGDVSQALQNGDHPLIELRNGTEGHVVVAYDVEDGDNGDKIIDVYDPNQPFDTYENYDTSGYYHQSVLQSSQIVVHSDGHWVFQGAFGDSPWHSGPGSLVVLPYGLIPVQPRLPNAPEIVILRLLTFFGPARVSQVTDAAGHTLLTPTGDVNTGTTGIPDATRFATLSGSSKPGAPPGSDIFLLGKPSDYSQNIVGTGAGPYHDALIAPGVAATLSADSARGVTDRVLLLSKTAGLDFGQTSKTGSSSRRVSAELLVKGSDGSEETATVVATMPRRSLDGVRFDAAHKSVIVIAGKQKMAYSLSLTWSGPHGSPQTFVAPKQTIGAGETAILTPAHWSTLDASPATLAVVHTNGKTTKNTVRNMAHAAGRFSVALKVTKGTSSSRLWVDTRFKRLVKGSSALITWEVLKGKAIVAHHSAALSGKKLPLGVVRRFFQFKGTTGAHYIFKGSVGLFSSTAASRSRLGGPTTSAFLSQNISKHMSLHG